MQWLHTLIVVFPLLIGAQGSASRLDNHVPEIVETLPADGVHTDIGPDVPQVRVLAGKRAGMSFTKKGKTAVKKENAEKNDGKNRCESCEVETVQAQQHQKGITPPKNEAQVDHVIPRAKGGDGEPDNGQVLCRDCNIKKSDKAP
jgi:5-methylcytosine-specific restriction endonuclease McrA